MMINKKRVFLPLLYIWVVLIFGTGCDPGNPETPEVLYREAVQDTVFAETNEICDCLVAITEDNDDLNWNADRVLVVTFTSFPDSYPEGETIQTWWGETWVTAVPELKNFHESIRLTADNQILRVEQVLGLPENSGNEWFAELWVDPDDLYRPCPDQEITDSICELSFPDNTTNEHIDWFNNQIIESYFQEQKYPWTRLGYTYNWGNPIDKVGLSEFIIRQDAEVLVKSLKKFEDYL